MKQKRILVCTFVAIASGLAGAYWGSQSNLATQTTKCDRLTPSLPGITILCQAWTTPFAWTEGGVTGLWCGTILGAFAAGLATHAKALEPSKNKV